MATHLTLGAQIADVIPTRLYAIRVVLGSSVIFVNDICQTFAMDIVMTTFARYFTSKHIELIVLTTLCDETW